ncbi:MAG: hypothetical protein R6V85_15360 [Polyangia bacterium]
MIGGLNVPAGNSRDYLAGDYWREFPAGTFRPPIIEPYRPKHRYWSGYV